LQFALIGISEADIQGIVDILDDDKNGEISLDEFQAFIGMDETNEIDKYFETNESLKKLVDYLQAVFRSAASRG
jgi:hypothetical protein